MAAPSQKLSKNQLRRQKKKAEKQAQSTDTRNSDRLKQEPSPEPKDEPSTPELPAQNGKRVAEPLVVDDSNPLFDMYKDVMGKFEDEEKQDPVLKEADKPEVYFDDENDNVYDEEEEEAGMQKISKKKRKEQSKLSVAELKALDPKMLVHLKSYRNVVPVPTHWSLKREYLSSKRGIEKAAFSLPKFIQETGIAEMRDAVLEKQNEASLKQQQRARVQPKMGKLDIDYQKLYEAFFKFQTKPELTRYGEVYYEGKEYETNLRHLRPGELSDELKEALNMPPGAPPPWLINQQRYGPPPSYPALKIPGLNAPPPPGASWGFHPGGYGKPPVDEATNRPLYGGDIFGVLQQQQQTQQGEPVEKDLWGELQAAEESEEEEEDEEEAEDEDEEEGGAGLQTPSGTQTAAGLQSSVPTDIGGTETVSEFDLRKRRGTETEESSQPRSAYTVVPERQTRVEGFFGGDRAYDLKAAQQGNIPVLGQEESRKRKKPGDVEVSMNPDDLAARDGLDKEDVRRAYDEQRKTEQPFGREFQEDLSDMIATESRKRQKRDEERRHKR
ncbi:hypothetical protein LTR05_005615 [Lithohypha guttulata]|uniref:PSP proline-rich domain-containing protein n=1 Tax=Lithohypha guttulata TaxID=1690604 RepID=A0AAN7Y5L5_9EURO|nr:hypothetical protein LTR05_005615 [Lithohypha guttulata]